MPADADLALHILKHLTEVLLALDSLKHLTEVLLALHILKHLTEVLLALDSLKHFFWLKNLTKKIPVKGKYKLGINVLKK